VELRTVLRGIGKAFIVIGGLILLFVTYQLWGTGIAEARSQRQLRRQLGAIAAPVRSTSTTTALGQPTTPTTPTTSTTSTTSTTPTTPTTVPSPLPPPPQGEALAILRIPSIGVDKAIVEGVSVSDLQKGPGHYPNSPLPGQPGNTAIAGHRTTYGAPFYHLDEVRPGAVIYISTRGGTYQYTVFFQHDVNPTDVSVIAPTTDNRLTLTTCTPRFSASHRLIVVASLNGPATAPPTKSPPRTVPQPGKPAAPPVLATVGSLSGAGQSTAPAILWASVCVLLWIGGFLFGRRWRKWPAYVLTTPVFLLALYFFFENSARFVPANI
jgi:sortase A